jgi:TolB protein
VLQRLLMMSLLLVAQVALALDLELTQGINAALPIGIHAFSGDAQGEQLASIVENDLKLSGQFKIITNPKSGVDVRQNISAWKQAGADSVLSGKVTRVGGNQFEVSYELLDIADHGRVLLDKSYPVSTQDMRALAHHISDEVYQKLTGERGIFSTRIAYILVQRNGDNARYTLEIAEVDGNNPQSLLISSEPIMSPTWSPDGRKIAYVSFEKKRAQIFDVDIATGKRRLLTSFPGINGAPSWSPDGREMAVVLSKGGAPKIYSVNLASGAMKQLTFGDSIDTEPRYSPDGRSILFTSGRGGSPQIYRLSLTDGKVMRMTYEGNYNARASYTPNQQQVIMSHRDENKKFNIAIQNVGNSQISTLTFAPQDESPSVAPNGRLILYATHQGDKGVLAMVSTDGRIRMLLPTKVGDVQEPAWSPFLGQ